MTDLCSIWAYEEIINSGYLGKKQSKVLSIFTSNPTQKYTATQIVEIIGRGVSETTRNRITELEQMGFLEKDGVVVCETTNRIVNLFKWSGRRNPFKKSIETFECHRCKGTGKMEKAIWREFTREDLFR